MLNRELLRRQVEEKHGSALSGLADAGVSDPTTATLARNLGKRQVKAPKVYVRDSDLLHELLGVADPVALARHPKSGASWEGFALDQILRIARPDSACFWATHGGAELDLLMFKDGRRIGVEFKRADAPALTVSMRVALVDLALDALYVVYPGPRRYRLADRVEAVPLSALPGA